MRQKKRLADYLRGWLPKEPNVPLGRMKNLRKPVAALVSITLLVVSVSVFVSLSFFSKPSVPPVIPEPVPTATPTPQPSPSPSPSPVSTSSLAPTPSQSLTPTASPPRTPSPTPMPASTPTLIPASSPNPTPTSTPFTGPWATVNGIGVAPLLQYAYRTTTTYYPKQANDLFLVVRFNLSAPVGAYPINVTDILVVAEGATNFSPCGFSGTSPWLVDSTNVGSTYYVGNFTGYITASAGAEFWVEDVVRAHLSNTVTFLFAYEVPIELLNSTQSFELKVMGSSMGQNFTVPLPLPTPVQTPTPTPNPTPTPLPNPAPTPAPSLKTFIVASSESSATSPPTSRTKSSGSAAG